MHVKQLELYNFQRIEHFSGNFEGDVYLVTGENELGKSTLLKAITVLLTGNRDEVLNANAEKGYAKAIVGDDDKEFEVKLSMTKSNPRGTLTIKSQDGMFSDRLSMLQQVFGYTDFDAEQFSAWSETAEGRRKQVELVMSLLPKKVQSRIVEIDCTVASIKDERKVANAAVKEAATLTRTRGESLKIGDAKKYAEPIDITALMESQREQAALEEKAKGVRAKKEEREATLAGIPDRRKKLKEDYEAALAALDAEEAENKEKLANCNTWLTEYDARPAASVEQQVADAREHNRLHEIVKEHAKAQTALKAAESKVADFEAKLAELAHERENLVNASALPIPGLTFTEDGLMLNGIPFENGKTSDSQIMEVSARIIMAKNPTVKVFRIGRGESLGAAKLKALVDFAKDNGYQGFIEQVTRGQNDLRVEEYTEK